MEYQIKKLRAGCDILVATPGRLLHFLRRMGFGSRQVLSREKLGFIVYDEADTFLEVESDTENPTILEGVQQPNGTSRINLHICSIRRYLSQPTQRKINVEGAEFKASTTPGNSS